MLKGIYKAALLDDYYWIVKSYASETEYNKQAKRRRRYENDFAFIFCCTYNSEFHIITEIKI